MTKQLENFETIIVKAQITATSNNNDSKFKQKKPSKTVYIVPDNKEDEKKLIDFGLTQYTPDNKKDKNAKPYFIIKSTQFVKFYVSEEEYSEVFFGTQIEEVNDETGETRVKKASNYMTSEPVYIAIMFVQGGDNGNDFYRLNAIMHENPLVLEEVKPINPFSQLFK